VVLSATLIGFLLSHYEIPALSLTAEVDTALPALTIPLLEWHNRTFYDHLSVVLPGIPFIILVSSIETIAIAKTFGTRFQYAIDPSQELVAIGLANFFTAFVSGYPIAGSFTKSSLNAQSGVRTPMGCVFTGLFVVLAQATISQCFQFVPKAALGAVIVVAVLMLIDIKVHTALNRENLQANPLLIADFQRAVADQTGGVDPIVRHHPFQSISRCGCGLPDWDWVVACLGPVIPGKTTLAFGEAA
jgi:solute carrier family 26 (sodium-independent sulfate anion transporter), member 11